MKYYEYTANVTRVGDDGNEKTMTEKYLIEDDSCMSAMQKGAAFMVTTCTDYETTGTTLTNIVEHLGDDKGEYIVKATVNIITIDEKTAKEKKHRVNYILHADCIAEAEDKLSEVMGKTLMAYQTVECKLTKYIEIVK